MRRVGLSGFIILLLLTQVVSTMVGENQLDDVVVLHSGNADRIVISASYQEITSDEALQLDAVIYDAMNMQVNGEIIWSASNGTITSDGLFYPWNVGIIQIQARFGNVSEFFNLSVVQGYAASIKIQTAEVGVKQDNTLTAYEIDSKGNSRISQTVIWMIDGVYLGQGQAIWHPTALGDYSTTVIQNQLQDDGVISVTPGSPFEFQFDDDIQLISGEGIKLKPKLVDINGFELDDTILGSKTFTAENGTITNEGWFSAIHAGKVNVTVSAGSITGEGVVTVLPQGARTSQVFLADELDAYVSGESYRVSVERCDSRQICGEVSPPLVNWSVGSGGFHVENNDIYWTPTIDGEHSISVSDSEITSSIDVEVIHGSISDVELTTSKSQIFAGDSVAIVLKAFDQAGNSWPVNSTIVVENGNQSQVGINPSFGYLNATSTGTWDFSASWVDEESEWEYSHTMSVEVKPGKLGLIALEGNGMILPADNQITLSPEFYDRYGNPINDVAVNWTIDDVDANLELLLNEGKWSSKEVGGHEIRVNAAGIFTTIRLNVVAGTAQHLVSDYDEDGLEVNAGVATDLFIQLVDIHGNMEPATDVVAITDDEIGELSPSSAGYGYWTFIGKQSGSVAFTISQGNAVHSIPIVINAGEPIRIESSIEGDDLAQGDVTLLRINGVDSYGNIVVVDPANVSIHCNAGDTTHITGGTWEVEINNAGYDRSCKVVWEGLIAQNFFDVESVLLGGALGSSNMAMGMISIVLMLVLGVIVVMLRKANAVQSDKWVNDAFEATDEVEVAEEQISTQVADVAPQAEATENQDQVEPIEPAAEPAKLAQPPQQTDAESTAEADKDSQATDPSNSDWIDEDTRKELAAKATEVGIMQAAPGCVQGKSGWYVDSTGEVQYWDVLESGEWKRVS